MSKKPTDNKGPQSDAQKAAKPKFDPFANPSPELLIARVPAISESHTLVLNKYPVIPNHFIIATKEDKPQTNLLEPGDLAMTYACLRAWRGDHSEANTTHDELFAFFNSGPHSGASQPHRHLQFLPVSDMQVGLSEQDTRTWQPLIQNLTVNSQIRAPFQIDHNSSSPFLALSTTISPSMTQQDLHHRYLTLLRTAKLFSDQPTAEPTAEAIAAAQTTASPSSQHVPLSYNLALTTERMAIAPRRAEGAPIPGLEGGEVALNGTILGGTLMVKERAEWDRLRTTPGALDEVLTVVGYPGLVGEAGRL